jgi:hypothetical protein
MDLGLVLTIVVVVLAVFGAAALLSGRFRR